MIATGMDISSLGDTTLCVVGAGPVGLALALAVARQGMPVTIIEAGGTDDVNSTSSNTEAEIADPAVHASLAHTSRRGLGGTSRIWGAGCMPYDPIAFQDRPYVPESGVPVSYEAVAAFHAAACEFFGCGRPSFWDGFDPPGGGLRTTNLIRFAPEPDMGRRHRVEIEKQPNLRLIPNATAVRLEIDPSHGELTALHVRSDGQAHRLVRPRLVLACGGIETARLLLCAQREHHRLFGGVDGPLGRYYMGHVSGEIARVQFAHRAVSECFGFERTDDGCFQRRLLTFSPEELNANHLLNIYFAPRNFPIDDAEMRSGALSALHLALTARYRTLHYMRHFRPGYIEPQFGLRLGLGPHLGNAMRDPFGTVDGLARILIQRLGQKGRPPAFHYHNPKRIFGLHYHSEMVPNRESRVTLSEKVDANGIPTPRIDFRIADQDIDSVVAAHRRLAVLLRETGLGRLDWMLGEDRATEHARSQASDGYHQIGLTRMSERAGAGVVDQNLRVHGLRNLWIAGCSVLPTSGKAHPTFTAVALALRLAEHLLRGG